MRKLLIVVMLLAAVPSFAQPFFKFELSNFIHGFSSGLSAGYLDKKSNIEIYIGYHVPVYLNTQPSIINLSIGKKIQLSDYKTDNFNITPIIGITKLSWIMLDQDKYPYRIYAIKPIYTIELSKDWYMGRLFVSFNYCKIFYYGIGIRAFIK